jgi:hypothetical protein
MHEINLMNAKHPPSDELAMTPEMEAASPEAVAM